MNIIKKEKVFDGYYSLSKVQVKSDKSGEIVEREQFKTPDSVGILVHQKAEKRVIMVKQFRIGPEQELLEIVAGKIEGNDQHPENTVRREVLEEVGFQVDRLQLIHTFFTSPGPVTEEMRLYYAEVSEQTASGGGLAAENEEIEIIPLSEESFKSYAFNDAKTIIAQQWFRLHHT